MKALIIDGKIALLLGEVTRDLYPNVFEKIELSGARIVDVEPCPTCHGSQYIEKVGKNG